MSMDAEIEVVAEPEHLDLRPIVYAPGTPKQHLVAETLNYARCWSDEHELSEWEFRDAPYGSNYGVYLRSKHRSRIVVNTARCKTPPTVPGFTWSWPGYKADVTVVGVIVHELGHHVWAEIRAACGPEDFKMHERHWRHIRESEAQVSSYEPVVEETFTEAFKLFMTNPELLREGRPERWAALLESGLTPPHATPWREVLRHAHPKLVAAAESWIAKGGE